MPGTVVLVVDDDPLIHQLLKAELEREGVHVLLGERRRGGAQAVAREPADGRSRSTVPAQARRLVRPGRAQGDPTARASGHYRSVEEQRSRGSRSAPCEYLVKPFEASRLVDVVESLGRRGARRSAGGGRRRGHARARLPRAPNSGLHRRRGAQRRGRARARAGHAACASSCSISSCRA